MTNTPTAPAPLPKSAAKPAGGLEGVVATSTKICHIDGQAGRLIYRGYDIGDLVENVTFEECCALLWDGDLPNSKQLNQLRSDLAESARIPGFVVDLLRTLPTTTEPMDALRTACSALGASDPDLRDNSAAANRRKAVRLTAQFPTIVCTFHHLRNGKKPVEPDPSLSIAGNFLYMLFGKKPHETLTRFMDAALVLHAEHGMNASTFAARVTAATLADMHASVTSALGALKGPLHGGANQDVMEMLLECKEVADVEPMVRDRLANKKKIPGFGHRVYKTFDPRATFLMKMARQLSEAAGNTKWYEMQQRMIPLMKNTPKSDGTPLNIDPNVDFFSATAYYTMGIPLDLFTPIFAIARISGWTAHIIEQQADNRIIRPKDDYIGPMDLKVKPIGER
jgi:citrate synthase